MKTLKSRRLFLSVLTLLIIGSVFVYLHFFRQTPAIEEKFVVEEEAKPTFVEEPPAVAETPTIEVAQFGSNSLLPGTKVSYQTFNNCGPANLSMILSYYGVHRTQKELGEQMRPYQHPKGDNDDKTIFAEEFVFWVKEHGLEAVYRPGGSLLILKTFLVNEIPVVVKTLLKTTEDSAHFRVVRGFDEKKQIIIADDSYFGPNQKISYFRFLEMWQPFNYVYIPVYRTEKKGVVEAILGQEMDEEVAYWRAINQAQKEAEKDLESVWPLFNLANSYYHVGQNEKCVAEFEKIESRLPRRALWYQIEATLAYRKLGNYDRVFEISERLFNNGNRAFSELYQLRGEIYLEQGNKEAARREFELALKYNHNFQPAKNALLQL